jgi:hypothetical protein
VADQPAEAVGVLAGGGDADDQVVLRRQAMEQHVEPGEQGREQAGAEPGAELLHPGEQVRREHM